MAFDFKKEDAAKYGREVYRAFRCKGNHRWDTCVFANESGGYAAVFRHSFRKKIIEDGKEFRRNVIDDETVVAAPDVASFIRATFPQLADAKELKRSGFFTRLRYLAEADAYRRDWPGHDGGVVLIWEGKAYGWKNCLRDAHHEQPGAIAIDTDGHLFIAEGGNDYDGAKCWVAMPEKDDV
ncbi:MULTISPECIES: antirestriction protein ArdR [Citrobacter freundii complex]|uniref:antirestriction protein ArdR n=1 Tax=Citrobacter TaxID=544 RepID=UPI0018348AC1|nr:MULTISPECIES: antirestriction protein ArdR [Citrobacter freundii complex]EDQ6204397.1 antirestriction protein ArdR [Salmonella enterica subsp. enterica serovar Anecho]EJD3478325.1 antirestriction protein ArdR [Salmonella enterica]MBA7940776.1 antirestriction protein ArdR [Citrobacter sp. RHBSTW-00509]HCB1820312.1 antirestriction protein ArdR [Citrobacter freundii]